MKQLLQNLANGQTQIIDAPSPVISPGTLLITTTTTLISAGTERMLLEFGDANLLGKAQQQPEKVKLVLEKMKTDGILTTIDAVRSKLNQPIPLGYSNVGIVENISDEVDVFKPGDRVVSNGRHADVVRVPKNLCAKIPDNVSDEKAAFTIVSSISLQGIRLAKPTLGETFVVIGVGLLGLITVQLLKAQGIKVLAIDIDENKLMLAKNFGAEIFNSNEDTDTVAAGMAFSKGVGVDGVIITASTKSNIPIANAAQMSRKRGRIILVGVTGLNINRADFYEKELTLQVSCSYGPGRYDPDYEENGIDYPIGFVRWTEQRNFEAVLEMMSNGSLEIDELISHRYNFENASTAYDTLKNDRNTLGILLLYNENNQSRYKNNKKLSFNKPLDSTRPVISFIGAGNYASRILIPSFKSAGAQLQTIVTSGGINSVFHGEKFGFREASTEVNQIFDNEITNTVVIATRHDTHALFVNKALSAGKNVFVEKPLAISFEELETIKSTYDKISQKNTLPRLMVGYNRRFSPIIKKTKELLESTSAPKSFIMTMNAGFIPSDHWVQDHKKGGGRIIGEACHYIDLMKYLANSEIIYSIARKMGDNGNKEITEDKAVITLGFKDGSFGSINYFANGHKSFPKERIEIFTSGKILQIDNFRTLRGFGWNNFKNYKLIRQDKGQVACPDAFIKSIINGDNCPLNIEDIFEVANVTIEVARQLNSQ